MIRSKKILNSARGETCTVNSPVCNYNPDTTVAAHSNWHEHGKGLGQKAHDIFVAYACSDCHAWLDSGQASRSEKRERWLMGHARTLVRLFEKGVIKL